jgi:hypothetical protein
VVQITAIEQLNSRSARIGTSAATPADGELLVSGNATVGSASANYWVLNGNSAGQPVYVNATGSDTNIGFDFNSKGTGNHNLNVGGVTRLNVSSTGLAVTGGIKFPQPQSASADANTLDDYEEGTFGGNAANDILQPATSGSITCAGYGFMSYTKVGRMVTIQGQVVVSAVTSPVGETRLNLPFPCRANSTNLDARAGSGIHCAALDFPTGCTSPTIWIGESESFANLQAVGSGVAWSYITIASAAAQTIAISFSYQTT